MSSPAERYQAAKERSRLAKTEFGRFRDQLTFELDEFQVQACQELEAGRGVLVAAPTGAGKTIVGEFAIHLAQARNTKAFYTTPIKALSNQKYTDLVHRYGEDKVGLLTGDTSINPEADIVVMTTEVLRNMLYAHSSTLLNLGYVVMDEVHYLADRFRGAVWEEVIIHLPESVQLVSLSATVSNAEEFGAWLDTVRGTTSVIVSEHRPVPLWQYMMVGNRLLDLFVGDGSERAKINPELLRLVNAAERRDQRADWGKTRSAHARYRNAGTKQGRRRDRQRGRGGAGRDFHERERGGQGQPRARQQKLSRPSVIRSLTRAELLPAIYFIFSRAACDDAVYQCMNAGISLTDRTEQAIIAARVDEIAQLLPAEDLEVLGYWNFRKAAMAGICAHHAGLLPIFKEAIEELFAAGLLKLVFATETLALGINMPARTVVIEKLQKFNGITHVNLTAGEYTQLTGRAGRRGIDVEGHAVVIHRPGLNPNDVAGLASKRTYPLNSSFAPTYNMSINLLAQYGRERARGILESSFAQFQADRSVVGLAQKVRQQQKSLTGYEEAFTCHLGDFREYARLRRELSTAEKEYAKSKSKDRFHSIVTSLHNLQVGDVFTVAGKRRIGTVVVLSRAHSLTDPRVAVLNEQAQLRTVSAHDLREPVELESRVRVSKDFNSNAPKQRRILATEVKHAVETGVPPRKQPAAESFVYQDDPLSQQIHQLKQRLADHPCHACPDREDHARWAARWSKLDSEAEQLRAKISGRTGTIAKRFDQYCALLTDYGYVLAETEGINADSGKLVTERGELLRKIYGEKDMLTAELIHHGSLNHLNPRELAAFVSALVYEAKREGADYHYSMPTEAINESVLDAQAIWNELRQAERRHGLPTTTEPDTGLIWPVYKWAGGKSLRECLRGTELSAGDFVRWIRQCIDVLEQIAKATSQTEIRDHCHAAVDSIRHGVVDYIGAEITENREETEEDIDEDEPTEHNHPLP